MASADWTTYRLLVAAALVALGAMILVAGLVSPGLPGASVLDSWLMGLSPAAGAGLLLTGCGFIAGVCDRPGPALAAAVVALLLSLLVLIGGFDDAADQVGAAVSGVGAMMLLLHVARFGAGRLWRTAAVGGAVIALALAGFGASQGAAALALLAVLAWPGPFAAAAPERPGATVSLVGPLAMFAVVLAGTLALWQVVAEGQRDLWQERSERAADRFHQHILDDLALRIEALERMARRWEQRAGLSEAEWRQDARSYVADFRGLEGMAVLERDLRPRWLEGQVQVADTLTVGFSGHPALAAVIDGVRREGGTRFSLPVREPHGPAYVYMVTAFQPDGETDVLLLSVRRLSHLFRRAQSGAEPGFVYQVVDVGGEPLFGPVPADGGPYRTDRAVNVAGAHWSLAAWPGASLLSRRPAYDADAVLLGGVGLALAALLVMRLSLVARARAMGSALQARALQHEVEERQVAERRRQATARRLEETLNSLSDGFFTVDPSLRVTYVNRVAAEVVGMDAEYLLGKPLWNLFPENRDVYAPIYGRVLLTGKAERAEVLDPSLDRWMEVRVDPVQNGLAVYFRDITESKRIRDQLFFQAQILEQIHDAVIAADLAGNVWSWNRGAEQLFGYTSSEMVGQPLRKLRPGPDYISLRQKLIDPLMRNGAHEAQVELEDRHGRRFMAMVSMSLTRDDDGHAHGMLALVMDISERFQFELDLQQALARAQIHAGRLRELSRISLALNTVRSRRRALEMLVADGRELLSAHLARVTLPGPEQEPDEIVDVVSRSEKYADDAGLGAEVDAALVNLVKRTGGAVALTGDALAEQVPAMGGIATWLGVPLMRHDGSYMGLLQFADRYKGAFTEDDEAVALQLGQLAAAVLDKTAALDTLRRVEADQREKLEFLNAITRSVAEGIVVTDAKGYVEYVNRSAVRLLEADPEDLIGQSLSVVLGTLESGERGDARDRWQVTRERRDGTRVRLALRVSQLVEGHWQGGQVVVFREEARDA